MTPFQLPSALHTANFQTLDPGTGNPITVDRWNQTIPLHIAASAAETNTLADPVKAGLRLTLYAASVGSGGSRVVTVASAYDQAGGTTLTFDAADERVVLESVDSGTAALSDFEWRVVDFEGATGPTADIGALKIGGTAVNATAAEINAAADVSARRVAVPDAATYTVLAANSGKTHVIPDLTASCTLTLPTAADGLEYRFIGKGVAADAQDWVFDTGAAANFYLGGLAFADTDAGAAADEIHAGVYPDGNSNDIMTIVTPGAGTVIELICDGTNWIVNGRVFSATVPTFAD